jgi:hypothetical protein
MSTLLRLERPHSCADFLSALLPAQLRESLNRFSRVDSSAEQEQFMCASRIADSSADPNQQELQTAKEHGGGSAMRLLIATVLLAGALMNRLL